MSSDAVFIEEIAEARAVARDAAELVEILWDMVLRCRPGQECRCIAERIHIAGDILALREKVRAL